MNPKTKEENEKEESLESSEYEDDENEGEEEEEEDDEEILKEAHARFELAAEAESSIRSKALEDFKFRAGDQWPLEVKNNREADGRPCLTINQAPQFIQKITNNQRANRSTIRVSPLDDQASIKTAKMIQGLIRSIERNSNADVAYDRALDSSATGGFGYFRVITDYEHHFSFNIEPRIKSVKDCFSIHFDPYSSEPDGSDANFAFVSEDFEKDYYKKKHPHSKLCSEADWTSIGNEKPLWMRDDGNVRIAEYFYRKWVKGTLVMTDQGQVFLKGREPQGSVIIQERKTLVPKVKWCKINAVEILEKRDWPGMYIPIIPVYGTELIVNGKRELEGIVRHMKDPQRMYNFWSSAETEAIALAPKSPFIAAEGQIEDYEHEWNTANTRNHSVLRYKPVSINGQPVPPPQRNVFEPAVQAITNAKMMSLNDMKGTTAIYDPSLGNAGNEVSGIAIQRRTLQSDMANFHYIDNLSRSKRHLGRILIDIIPYIYDNERVARVIGEDDQEKMVKFNTPYVDPDTGETVLYRFDVGKYDVAVDDGPSLMTRRQEAAQSILDVIRVYPALAQYASDLLVKNMDWPGAQEFADRLKKTIPPELLDEKKMQVPPQVQAQMGQMKMMIEQLTNQLNQAQDDIDKDKYKVDSQERIKMREIEAEIEITRAKLNSSESLELLSIELEEIKRQQEMMMNRQGINDLGTYHQEEAQGQMEEQEPYEEPQQGMEGQMEGQEIESTQGELSQFDDTQGTNFGAGDQLQNPTGGISPGMNMER